MTPEEALTIMSQVYQRYDDTVKVSAPYKVFCELEEASQVLGKLITDVRALEALEAMSKEE